MHDPKFNTSLYNHKMISDGVTPLISNREYSELLKEVMDGNFEPYEIAKTKFCFEPKQEKFINDIINNRIV